MLTANMNASKSFKQVVFSMVLISATFGVQSLAVAQDAGAKPAFDGTTEVSSIVTNGNTNNQTTGVAFDLTYRPAPWLVNVKSKYLTTVTQDVQTQESFEASGRGGRSLTDVVAVFVEHSYLKNRFAGTDNRFITSGGLGFGVLKNDTHTLKFETALGYTHEDRIDGSEPAFMSGVVAGIYKLKLSPTSDFSHETRYQPNFRTTEDWRLTTETALVAAISSMLSSKVAWKYEHVNVPPAGKVKGDTTTTVSLLAKF
jgi:putative salt-induced outer membrane protein YdiY